MMYMAIIKKVYFSLQNFVPLQQLGIAISLISSLIEMRKICHVPKQLQYEKDNLLICAYF